MYSLRKVRWCRWPSGVGGSLAVALLLAAPAWGQPLPSMPLPTAAQSYRVQVGDQLDVKLFYNSDLNDTVTVRPDGYISLQLVGEVLAEGKTPSVLTAELTGAFAKQLREPEVTVIVRSFPPPQVFLDGEIGRPGTIPIPGSMSLLQALSAAGGLKRSARLSEVVIVRQAAGVRQVIKTDLRPLIKGELDASDPLLRPYDIVLVPRTKIAKVNDWVDQYLRQNLPFTITFGLFATPY